MGPVPVLMYHHVNKHKGDMVTVVPEVFERQMRYLNKAGYRTLRADELLSYIKGDLSFDGKVVMITFDDGWLDNYVYAFPVLRKYNINATIFIATDWIKEGFDNISDLNSHIHKHREARRLIEQGEAYKAILNWKLIREMSESGLVEFYSHTKSHRKASSMSEDELSEELQKSKQTIEKKLSKDCSYLCWPFGSYNETAVKIARATGYKAVFTTQPGVVKKDSDPFTLRRIVVKDSQLWFMKSMIIYSSSLLSRCYIYMKGVRK